MPKKLTIPELRNRLKVAKADKREADKVLRTSKSERNKLDRLVVRHEKAAAKALDAVTKFEERLATH